MTNAIARTVLASAVLRAGGPWVLALRVFSLRVLALRVLALWVFTLWVFRTSSAVAVSLGDMADKAAADLDTVPGLLAIGFYIVGAAVAGFGLLKLKRHVDHPQQTTLGSGLIAILIGVALIAAPAVINGLGDTFGLGGASQTVARPKL